MTGEDPLARLIAAQERLIAALDGDDAAAIEAALAEFHDGLVAVQAAAGMLRGQPGARERIEQALALAEAARIRTAYLADRTRRQLGRLAELGRTGGALSYGRDGRLRAPPVRG